MIEVNRPEEIDALLSETAAHLKATGFPMEGRQLVFVNDDRKYVSGAQSENLAREPYEASPYASVDKYSHNVLPARAALGANGCTDCHAHNSAFFDGRNLQRPFDESGRSVWLANYEVIGLPALQVRLGAWREAMLKPALYLALLVLAIAAAGLLARWALLQFGSAPGGKAQVVGLGITGAGLILLAAAAWTPRLLSYMAIDGFTLDANHFWISSAVLGVAALCAVALRPGTVKTTMFLGVAVCAITGVLMVANLWWLTYTVFDAAVLLLAILLLAQVLRHLVTRGLSFRSTR